jgi:hypothetical protein
MGRKGKRRLPLVGCHANVSTKDFRTKSSKGGPTGHNHDGGDEMSKGMDSKKSDKKKPAKTMKEKKAAKEEKKRNAK